jgi:hypothetical protein
MLSVEGRVPLLHGDLKQRAAQHELLGQRDGLWERAGRRRRSPNTGGARGRQAAPSLLHDDLEQRAAQHTSPQDTTAACGEERTTRSRMGERRAARERRAAQRTGRKRAPAGRGQTDGPQVKTLGWIRFGLEFILAIGSIIHGGFGWRRYVVPCKSYGTGSVSPNNDAKSALPP